MNKFVSSLVLICTFYFCAAEQESEGFVRVELKKETTSEHLNRYRHYKRWQDYKTKFGKTYESQDEELEKFGNFYKAHKLIKRHNEAFENGLKTFKLALNEFSDIDHAEFIQRNGFKKEYGDKLKTHKAPMFMAPHHVQLPENVDWRNKGYVTPVKNQGACGSCWSFSSTGALEGQHKRKTGRLVSLSEQNLVDCSARFGNHGCNGGLMDNAFRYVKANGGIDTETSYPYEAKDDQCRFNRTSVGAEDVGYMDITEGDEDALKQAVATQGPVSVAIDASHRSFQSYDTGVYYEPQCSPESLDHGVLVVGYGTSDEGQDYWLVKNSWGPTWGEEGFIKMARNRDNNCGIASSASYPLV